MSAILLHLSAAFDTVDHDILMDILQPRMVDFWVMSQVVWVSSCQSSMTNLVTVLGPMMFLECAKDVCHLLTRLQCQLFADDVQGLKHGLPTDVTQIVSTFFNDCMHIIIHNQVIDCVTEYSSLILLVDQTWWQRIWMQERNHIRVVATSVLSEWVYSKTGQLISPRRSQLSLKLIQMPVFLNHYYRLIEWLQYEFEWFFCVPHSSNMHLEKLFIMSITIYKRR